YQLYFNLVRPNSHKENLSPWQIIERLAPRSPLELCLLPPVFLDYYLNDSGGYDVGRLPYSPLRPPKRVTLDFSCVDFAKRNHSDLYLRPRGQICPSCVSFR